MKANGLVQLCHRGPFYILNNIVCEGRNAGFACWLTVPQTAVNEAWFTGSNSWETAEAVGSRVQCMSLDHKHWCPQKWLLCVCHHPYFCFWCVKALTTCFSPRPSYDESFSSEAEAHGRFSYALNFENYELNQPCPFKHLIDLGISL